MNGQPHTLTAADLTALPTGSVVRYTTERGTRPAVALKATNTGPDRDKWFSSDSMAPVSSLTIAANNPVLYAPVDTTGPGTSRERPAHDAGGVDAGSWGALVQLAEDYESVNGVVSPDIRAVLAARPTIGTTQ
jgi:hypothetical protein